MTWKHLFFNVFWNCFAKETFYRNIFRRKLASYEDARGGIVLESFLHKLMVDLYMRPGTDILSTERNFAYIFFTSSEQLEIFQSNFETLIKDSKEIFKSLFLKFETSLHSQIAISRYCILITNFLTWQGRIQNPVKHLRRSFLRKKLIYEGS